MDAPGKPGGKDPQHCETRNECEKIKRENQALFSEYSCMVMDVFSCSIKHDKHVWHGHIIRTRDSPVMTNSNMNTIDTTMIDLVFTLRNVLWFLGLHFKRILVNGCCCC